MRGVGHHEFETLGDIACGAVKDRALGYVSLSNAHIDHMSHMGVTSLVTNCDRSIHGTSKKVAPVRRW
jgi:hypothetical protein